MNWHTSTIEAVFKELQSGGDGLSTDEVTKRMQQYGANQLQEKKKKR